MGLCSKFQPASLKTLACVYNMSVIFRHKYIKNAQNSGFLIIFFRKKILIEKKKSIFEIISKYRLCENLEALRRKLRPGGVWTDAQGQGQTENCHPPQDLLPLPPLECLFTRATRVNKPESAW